MSNMPKRCLSRREDYPVLVVYFLVFFTLLVLTVLTPMVSDDYPYSFSWVDWTRLRSVSPSASSISPSPAQWAGLCTRTGTAFPALAAGNLLHSERLQRSPSLYMYQTADRIAAAEGCRRHPVVWRFLHMLLYHRIRRRLPLVGRVSELFLVYYFFSVVRTAVFFGLS